MVLGPGTATIVLPPEKTQKFIACLLLLQFIPLQLAIQLMSLMAAMVQVVHLPLCTCVLARGACKSWDWIWGFTEWAFDVFILWSHPAFSTNGVFHDPWLSMSTDAYLVGWVALKTGFGRWQRGPLFKVPSPGSWVLGPIKSLSGLSVIVIIIIAVILINLDLSECLF